MRLINADELEQRVFDAVFHDNCWMEFDLFEECLANTPTVGRTGRLIMDGNHYHCTACTIALTKGEVHWLETSGFSYCPNCGAKWEEESEVKK